MTEDDIQAALQKYLVATYGEDHMKPAELVLNRLCYLDAEFSIHRLAPSSDTMADYKHAMRNIEGITAIVHVVIDLYEGRVLSEDLLWITDEQPIRSSIIARYML